MLENNKSQDPDNLKDPNIKLYSPYFLFKYFIRELGYQIPPSRIKFFFLRLSGIVIHENAWVGAGSILLPDSSLGKRSILGAGSVLTKKTNENEIWHGSPATFKKKLY